MRVEVAYAKPEEQAIIVLDVDEGCSAEQAVLESDIVKRFPEIDLAALKLGVFGKAVKNSVLLRAGDRVEIYRPLIADPKAVRKAKAKTGDAIGKRK